MYGGADVKGWKGKLYTSAFTRLRKDFSVLLFISMVGLYFLLLVLLVICAVVAYGIIRFGEGNVRVGRGCEGSNV